MAVNEFMHPRNIYRSPPDFSQLARDYPEFAKHVIVKPSGAVHLNFKSLDALRALTTTLLKKDFDLDVTLPPNRLVPTLPLRLNYILWIEDLLEAVQGSGADIYAIDIGNWTPWPQLGAGASCIYPLLGAKKNGWKFIATEVDEDAVKWAQSLITRNSLDEYIEIVKVDSNEVLLSILDRKEQVFEFCMCNPPFFCEPFDASRRHKPSVNKEDGAANCERVYEGGEEVLVRKIIEDSQVLRGKVRIYTSMIGKKKAFLELKSFLHSVEDIQFTTTEFCQGNVTRWGIAWSFIPEIKLNEIRNKKVGKHKNIKHSYAIPPTTEDYSVPMLQKKVESLLTELKIIHEILVSEPYMVTMSVKAFENTWIHQRRKRREMERNRKREEGGKTAEDVTAVLTPDVSKEHLTKKRKHDGSPTECFDKWALDFNASSKAESNLNDPAFERTLVLSCHLSLVKAGSSIHLSLYDCDEAVDTNPMCQLLQFFKNKLK